MKPKKRFIAGAVCPQCQQQDSLLLHVDEQGEQVICVVCGYQFADRQAPSASQVIARFPLPAVDKPAKS